MAGKQGQAAYCHSMLRKEFIVRAERKHRRKARYLLFLGVLIWSLFIWSNSCRPAAESASHSLQVLSCFEPIFQALHIPTDLGHTLIRKAAHMTEFLVLGVLWTAVLLWGLDKRIGSSIFTGASLCLMTALVDESIQLVSPGRGSLVADVWIDFVGSCIGILLVSMIHILYRFVHRSNAC